MTEGDGELSYLHDEFMQIGWAREVQEPLEVTAEPGGQPGGLMPLGIVFLSLRVAQSKF